MAQVQYVEFGKTDPVFARIRADADSYAKIIKAANIKMD